MPYDFTLPAKLANAGWKVKIHDAEGAEEPHVTIYKKLRKWRVSLRTKKFLDKHDKWSQIDKELKKEVDAAWKTLQKEWDKIHGKVNPISSKDNDDGDQKN